MADTDTSPATMTDGAPATPTQALEDAKHPEQPTPSTGETPDDSGRGSKDAVLADLARERDKRQAAEKATADAAAKLDAVLAALGLGETKEDPATAAQQARDAQRTAEARLAVYTHAPDGLNPKALLDSVTVTTGLASIDPADEQAITAYLAQYANDPRFRLTPAGAGASDAGATNHSPGTGPSMDDWIRGQ